MNFCTALKPQMYRSQMVLVLGISERHGMASYQTGTPFMIS